MASRIPRFLPPSGSTVTYGQTSVWGVVSDSTSGEGAAEATMGSKTQRMAQAAISPFRACRNALFASWIMGWGRKPWILTQNPGRCSCERRASQTTTMALVTHR